ncbi:MAG: NAD+ synthase [Phycisphaerae bacterium]|nr:NAD+ synthase [Phycisphaerae bacterium]
MRLVRIALGQFNATVGDLAGNVEKMKQMWARAVEAGADLVAFPELAICGYPPEDLVYKKQFVKDNRAALEELAAWVEGAARSDRGRAARDTQGRDALATTLVVGFVECSEGNLYNSAAVIQAGRIVDIYRKTLLPNTSVFDEQRYFKPGARPVIIDMAGLRVALTICQDIWDDQWLASFFAGAGRIDLMVNISASPFHVNKIYQRHEVVGDCAQIFRCAVAYCNLVGGQDELVFDGRSLLTDSMGRVVTQAKAFDEDLLLADIEAGEAGVHVRPLQPPVGQPKDEVEEVYQALVLGTRDYALKNGFQQVLLGISGGIDSAVTAAIAAAALGPQNVICVTMPSRFNSPGTIADAKLAADNLGCPLLTIPIEPILKPFNESLKAEPRWNDRGLAYENLQARIRGMILMSLSNQIGALVLTTGNKSEVSVGYSTLYGDTAGGFSVIKDVLKTMVYRLAEYMNELAGHRPGGAGLRPDGAGREAIPVSVIQRVPTAELRPNQRDRDSLPEYDVLDRIIMGYVEQDQSARDLVESGLPAGEVERVIRMIDRNEYKRRQSPPGVRITAKAFGKDRRLPITNHYTTTIRKPEIRNPKSETNSKHE